MNTIWKITGMYLLIIFFLIISSVSANGQIKAIYFNAEWNAANNVDWFSDLNDTKKQTMDIGEGDCQEKYQIAIVPTIVIFKDGEEVKRFQADLSFKMVATKEEVQEEISNQLMSDF